MSTENTMNPQALAALTYRLADVLGHDAPLVQALKLAAETGDADAGALAWDQIMKLPAKERQALADWFARVSGQATDTSGGGGCSNPNCCGGHHH